MAEIRHLENRHDVVFFCRGWSDLDKMSETVAEWHVDCGDVVEIETRCRIPIWRTFGRIQWHVIPEPSAALQGAATCRIQCLDSRATCHIAECCHLVKSLSRFQSATLQGVRIPSAIFYLFLFLIDTIALNCLLTGASNAGGVGINRHSATISGCWRCYRLCQYVAIGPPSPCRKLTLR